MPTALGGAKGADPKELKKLINKNARLEIQVDITLRMCVCVCVCVCRGVMRYCSHTNSDVYIVPR